ncbi:MAG: DNA alkylation repair protein [Lentisphaerae bacterium]|nr:DNA alkylation repair protein [Lentisphaerota bacterium]
MSAQTKRVLSRLKKLGDPAIAAHSRTFFKTGKGGYAEGDQFLGIRVPVLRKCAGEHLDLRLTDTLELLKSPLHEARLLALLIWIAQYSRSNSAGQKALYHAYLGHTKYINNWDLVDCSAEHIVGAHLSDKDRKPLYRLARSRSLWERRISVLATFHFIKQGDFAEILAIARLLLRDPEDLIHKAAGWMLREVGKRNLAAEKAFLARHTGNMPRTMLRYAIERFPERERQAYLQGIQCKDCERVFVPRNA